MIRGIYIAASGMMAQEAKQSAISNNLANVSTPGFKRDIAVGESFSDIVSGLARSPIGRLGMSTAITAVCFDNSPGSMASTENPFDLAIEGDGMFVVQTDAGIRYTRTGNFRLDAESFLITQDGHRVLGVDGPIRVDGSLVVQNDGSVYSDGEFRGRLSVMVPTTGDGLVKVGGGLFAERAGAAAGMVQVQPGEARVIQGQLESTNVNVVREMVDMIAGYRTYEAAQRALLSHDALLDKAVNEVGRVG
ncbi:MAG TPA: flagellar hook-basal body protein [Bacillota bacterium]|nr:flagellar hook-basal body protein [Bacillota bacterium]